LGVGKCIQWEKLSVMALSRVVKSLTVGTKLGVLRFWCEFIHKPKKLSFLQRNVDNSLKTLQRQLCSESGLERATEWIEGLLKLGISKVLSTTKSSEIRYLKSPTTITFPSHGNTPLRIRSRAPEETQFIYNEIFVENCYTKVIFDLLLRLDDCFWFFVSQ